MKSSQTTINEPQKLDTLLARQPGTEFCIEQDSVLLVLP